jgi:CheY-like chemotaxis protein
MSTVSLTCLIDDDEIFVYAMKKIINLKQLSRETITFDRVEKALDYFSINKNEAALLPDVVLLDINLPGEDGWDFIESFEQISAEMIKKPKIYMLSSSANPADQQKALSNKNIENYYVKPLSKDNFKEIFGYLPA